VKDLPRGNQTSDLHTSAPSNYNLQNSECILEDSSIPTAVNSAFNKLNGEISAANI
jgi:hypothetical protein